MGATRLLSGGDHCIHYVFLCESKRALKNFANCIRVLNTFCLYHSLLSALAADVAAVAVAPVVQAAEAPVVQAAVAPVVQAAVAQVAQAEEAPVVQAAVAQAAVARAVVRCISLF